MTYARPLTILAILGISTASLYAYTYKTPEKRIRDCDIKIQNINSGNYPHLRNPEHIKKTLLCAIMYCEEKLFTISLT